MLVAIIATIATLVVLIGLAIVVVNVRNRNKGAYAKKSATHVKNINSVGVSSSFKESKSKGSRSASSPQPTGPETRINPREALRYRFLAMGVLVAGIFGSLTAKLWSLQILSSEEYSEEAEENLYVTLSTPAPRGVIYDANGKELVKNRVSLTVLADADIVDNHDVVQRLSTVLGIPFNIVRQRIQDATSGAQSQRVVASNVTLRNIAYIDEHPEAFPGVTTQVRTIREYPYGALAAHVLGYTGTANEEELKSPPEGRRYEMGDQVGKEGVEFAYEKVLAGDHGERTVIADAHGVVRGVVNETPATKGDDIYLTIDAKVQHLVDTELAELILPSDGSTGKGVAGSAVVLDVQTGAVIAMSNFPTYSPEVYIGGISQETLDLYQDDKSRRPLVNRAIAGGYAAASTYKAFTGLAGLKYGFGGSATCSGTWTGFGEKYPQDCWDHGGHGTLSLHEGVVHSCDVVFYEIAKSFYTASQNDDLPATTMQDCIKEFGLGSRMGIEIPGEIAGAVPTPDYKKELFKDRPEEGSWVPGDMSNMVIGQGLVLVTPLQIAAAYGGVATGKVMRPHLLKEVSNASGKVDLKIDPEVIYEPDFSDEHFQYMRTALRGVATESAKVAEEFNKYNISAAAKTGTAEVQGKEDFAWFACYGPFEEPKYVVACVIEQGGGGSDTATPLGAKILSAVLQNDAGELEDKVAKIAGSAGEAIADVPVTSSGRQY